MQTAAAYASQWSYMQMLSPTGRLEMLWQLSTRIYCHLQEPLSAYCWIHVVRQSRWAGQGQSHLPVHWNADSCVHRHDLCLALCTQ
jgi:hypothetical protein